MLTLAPRENRQEPLPEQVGGLTLSNETIASIDLSIEIEGGNLKIAINGIYLGKTQEAPFEVSKKKWVLT